MFLSDTCFESISRVENALSGEIRQQLSVYGIKMDHIKPPIFSRKYGLKCLRNYWERSTIILLYNGVYSYIWLSYTNLKSRIHWPFTDLAILWVRTVKKTLKSLKLWFCDQIWIKRCIPLVFDPQFESFSRDKKVSR